MKKLVLTLFLSLLIVLQTTTKSSKELNEIIVLEINSKLFSEINFYNKILKMDIAYPEVVFAQALIETGNFTSNIYIENNNLFGMKLPKRRQTTAIGENRNHAIYTSWTQSLADYKLWQDKMIHKAPTLEDYLNYLGRNYAEDKNYIKKIRKTMKKLKLS
jgi:flagellum-specific peptidoglycan hydrolase FlgJ